MHSGRCALDHLGLKKQFAEEIGLLEASSDAGDSGRR